MENEARIDFSARSSERNIWHILEQLQFNGVKKVMSMDVKGNEAVFMVQNKQTLELWRWGNQKWKKLVIERMLGMINRFTVDLYRVFDGYHEFEHLNLSNGAERGRIQNKIGICKVLIFETGKALASFRKGVYLVDFIKKRVTVVSKENSNFWLFGDLLFFNDRYLENLSLNRKKICLKQFPKALEAFTSNFGSRFILTRKELIEVKGSSAAKLIISKQKIKSGCYVDHGFVLVVAEFNWNRKYRILCYDCNDLSLKSHFDVHLPDIVRKIDSFSNKIFIFAEKHYFIGKVDLSGEIRIEKEGKLDEYILDHSYDKNGNLWILQNSSVNPILRIE